MTSVVCKMKSCVHRSKRPLRKLIGKDGSPLYGCTLKFISIGSASSKEAHCVFYNPNEDEEEDGEMSE